MDALLECTNSPLRELPFASPYGCDPQFYLARLCREAREEVAAHAVNIRAFKRHTSGSSPTDLDNFDRSWSPISTAQTTVSERMDLLSRNSSQWPAVARLTTVVNLADNITASYRLRDHRPSSMSEWVSSEAAGSSDFWYDTRQAALIVETYHQDQMERNMAPPGAMLPQVPRMERLRHYTVDAPTALLPSFDCFRGIAAFTSDIHPGLSDHMHEAIDFAEEIRAHAADVPRVTDAEEADEQWAAESAGRTADFSTHDVLDLERASNFLRHLASIGTSQRSMDRQNRARTWSSILGSCECRCADGPVLRHTTSSAPETVQRPTTCLELKPLRGVILRPVSTSPSYKCT